MEEKIVRILDLPAGVRGLTLLDEDGNYNIYINAKLDMAARLKAYNHELEHIRRGDWQSSLPVSLIEQHVRAAVGR